MHIRRSIRQQILDLKTPGGFFRYDPSRTAPSDGQLVARNAGYYSYKYIITKNKIR
jgi:hypothetical protein